jgi:hypothetical protein
MSTVKRMKSSRRITGMPVENEPVMDASRMGPDELRDAVRDSLLALKFDERAMLVDKLIAGLKKARLNLGAAAMLLGIQGETINDLTPSDVAHLLRYVRINNPAILACVKPQLNELLGKETETRQRSGASRKAA